MKFEDQQRFEVEPGHYAAEAQLVCGRCGWSTEIIDPLSLAELNQRADEHAEVCP